MLTRQFWRRRQRSAVMIAAPVNRIGYALFFQRRLVIEGDTELGLYVKNLMDAIELEQMPKALRVMLLQLADFC